MMNTLPTDVDPGVFSLLSISHRLGCSSDLSSGISSYWGLLPRASEPYGVGGTALALETLWNDDDLRTQISAAEERLYSFQLEVRPDEYLARHVEGILHPLRGLSLGDALKQRASEALYGLDCRAFAVRRLMTG